VENSVMYRYFTPQPRVLPADLVIEVERYPLYQHVEWGGAKSTRPNDRLLSSFKCLIRLELP
jgi:hypothetical protein